MRRNIAPILWVLILGAIPAAMYGWYFLGQRQRIADLNQRELGRAAENLRSILQNAAVTVTNLTKDPAFTCLYLKRQPYLVMPPGKRCQEISNGKYSKQDASLHAGDDGLTVTAPLIPPSDTGMVAGSLEFRVNLEKVLDDLVGNGFEYLFVADENGQVLFQTRRGEQKRWIDQLPWADRHARDESVKPASPLRLRNIAGLAAGTGGEPALQRLIGTSNSQRVEIAGEGYRLYLQPLGSLAEIAPRSDTKAAIVLGGLVNARASIAEALAVDPRLALGLAVLAGIGLLTWPLLKLLVLAPSERFKFVDFYLLLLSAAALLGVCTVVLLDLDNYQRLDLSRGNGLESLAETLAADLISELSGAARQLSAYDSAQAAKGPMDCQGNVEGKNLFVSPGTQELQARPPDSHKHLISAFWVRGDDGMQFAKLTTIGANTPFVNVVERTYFREAREKHLWEFAPSVRGAYSGPGFFVQIYRSITTGDFETGLSMPSDVICTDTPTPGAAPASGAAVFPNVAVLTTTLASLGPKALPADYGFMMIDRSGRVLYHSDPRLALRENLFEEVSNPERLRALVMAEWAARITTSYRGVPHELYIRPLRELVTKQPGIIESAPEPKRSNGWFIVSFRDLRLSQTVNSEATLTALVWCAFYFVPVLFVPAFIFIVRGPKHNSWIWPNRAKETLYRSLAIRLIGLTALAVVAIVVARGWGLAVASCLIGLSAVALGTREYLRWKHRQEQGGYRNSGFLTTLPFAPPWQLATAALLLILVSVLPAAGFFRFSWNQELASLLAYDARHMAETKEDLKRQITDRAQDKFAAVYGKTWYQVVKGAIEEQTSPVIWRDYQLDMANVAGSVDVLAPVKPVYNDATAALRYERSNPGLVARQNLSMRPGLLALVGGVLLIGTLLWQIRYWAKRLLLSDLADTAPATANVMSEIQAAQNEGRNLIIVTSSRAQEDAIRKLVAGPAMPMVAAALVGGGSQSLPGLPGRDTVFDLTKTFRTPQSRQAGLSRLEQIAADGHGIVFSRVDPAIFLFGDLPVSAPSGGAHLDEWERRRWSDVLERFSILSAPLPPDVTAEEVGTTRDAAGECTRRRSLYWSLWNSCTNVEKLELVQVAEEGFANPQQRRTVEYLLRRGLLIMAPDLRPFHPDFRRFIQEVYERKTVAEWERPTHGIGWKQARWILTIMVVTVALFLIATQRQALTPVVTFVSTLTGAFVGVLKLISEMTPKQSAPK
jgi:hypothetical protein